MTGIGIIGWGMYVLARTVSDAELSERFCAHDEWIVRRTGIRHRRIVGAGETTASLAVEAGRRASTAPGCTRRGSLI